MNSIEAVAEVIQLAVAPVFLLAGIAGLLGVLSTRLARIIDRARVIERRIPQAKRDEQRTLLRRETKVLWRRIALINWAIRLCIAGALAVCLVIVALFVGEFVAFNIAVAVAVLFVLAMVLIVAGLVFLLSEVSLSTRHMREGMELALEDAAETRASRVDTVAFKAVEALDDLAEPVARALRLPRFEPSIHEAVPEHAAHVGARLVVRNVLDPDVAVDRARRQPPRSGRLAGVVGAERDGQLRVEPLEQLRDSRGAERDVHCGSNRSARFGAGSCQRRAVSRAVAGQLGDAERAGRRRRIGTKQALLPQHAVEQVRLDLRQLHGRRDLVRVGRG